MISYENIWMNTVFMLLVFIFAYYLFYILIPSKLIIFEDDEKGLLDRVFISLIHSNMITIFMVHLLAFLSIYETFSLLFAYLICCIAINRITRLSEGFKKNLISKGLRLLDFLDSPGGFSKNIKKRIISALIDFVKNFVSKARQFFLMPFGGIMIFLTLLVAAYIRFHHSIINLYFGASDPYVHMEWVKFIGSNKIYNGGIYPNGYHAIISALNKLSFIDPYYIIRFIGPLAGLMMVLSLYYMLRKLYKKDQMIAWAATFIYVAGLSLPRDVWRQISGLPQEYAAVFLFPGMYFFHKYINTSRKKFLILTGECFCLTLLIHPYITVFLTIGYFFIFIVNMKKVINIKMLLTILCAGFLSGILGVMPLAVGYLLGKQFHGSLGYVQNSAEIPTELPIKEIPAFRENNNILIAFLIVCVILMLLWIVMLFFKNKENKLENIKADAIIVLSGLLLYALYRAPELKLPVLMDVNRIGIFLSFFVAATFGIAVTFLFRFLSRRKLSILLKFLVAALTVVYVTKYSDFVPPKGMQYQYNEAVYGYLKARNESFPLDWTIISPVEEYGMTLGYGWHYQLSEFVYKLSDPDTNKIQIPTEIIFMFIEKKPLNSNSRVSLEYTKRELPRDLINSSDIYADEETRMIIESKAFYWAQNFMKRHKNVEIVFEDENIQLYRIRQDKDNLIDFKNE